MSQLINQSPFVGANLVTMLMGQPPPASGYRNRMWL